MEKNIIRVGMVGCPGSGKTTLARMLSAKARGIETLKNVELVSEYARRHIVKYGQPDLFRQIRILNKQIDWEESIGSNVDLMITDSPIHLGWLYANELKTTSITDTLYINDLFKMLNTLNINSRYDYIFHLSPRKPIDDGVRASNQFSVGWQKKFDMKIRNVFSELFPCKNYLYIEEQDLEKRLDICLDKLK